MTEQRPLEYYQAGADDEPRAIRPRAVTAVAVTGIALVATMLLAQTLNLWGAVWREAGGGRGGLFSTSEDGWALARLVGNTAASLFQSFFAVSMVIGCFGVLALRAGARSLMIVAAYGWIVFGALQLFVLYWLASASKRAGYSTGDLAPIAVVTAILLAYGAFPAWVLTTLRRPEIASLFAGRSAAPSPLYRLLKPIAIVTLIWGGLCTLDGVTTVVNFIARIADQNPYYYPRLLPPPVGIAGYEDYQPGGRAAGWLTVDAILFTVLYGTLTLGSILLLTRQQRRAGANVVICVAVALLTFTVSMWANAAFAELLGLPRLTFRWRGVASLRAIWLVFARCSTLLGQYVSALALPTLLLILCTHRPPAEPRGGAHAS
jgi:hypothetical protein